MQNWANIDSQTRQGLKQQYNHAGISLVVSAFGQTELPTSAGLDPAVLAGQMAQFVLNTDLDGIDVDWEEFDLVTEQPNVGEQWLATFTQMLRSQLPKGQFILSHAPIGPWFQPGACPGGCYLTVDQTVGSLIDWVRCRFYSSWERFLTYAERRPGGRSFLSSQYNIQFYNRMCPLSPRRYRSCTDFSADLCRHQRFRDPDTRTATRS